MAKWCNDSFLDAYLDYIGDCTMLNICSAQPSSYAEATSDFMLAQVVLVPGGSGAAFTKADDTSGRKLTVTQQTSVVVTNPGTATHIALTRTVGTLLKLITTCDSQALLAAGYVTVPAFKVNIQDPV